MQYIFNDSTAAGNGDIAVCYLSSQYQLVDDNVAAEQQVLFVLAIRLSVVP